jgi:hypothetical protein
MERCAEEIGNPDGRFSPLLPVLNTIPEQCPRWRCIECTENPFGATVLLMYPESTAVNLREWTICLVQGR